MDHPGVEGTLFDGDVDDSQSSSSEGIDSVDRDRTKDSAPTVVSLPKLPYSESKSSGGLKSTSQDCGLDVDIEDPRRPSPGSCLLPSFNAYRDPGIVEFCSCGLGSGADVIASKAATEEGTESGS